MTKEAVNLEPGWLSKDVYLAASQAAMLRELGGVAGLIKEIERLRAAARPAPDAGLVERLRATLPDKVSDQAREIAAEILSDADEERHNPSYAAARWVDALLSTRTVAGEPVAWRWRDPAWPKDGYWAFTSNPHQSQGFEIEPLYATPAPQAGRAPETRQTFTVPDGFEAVRDAEGRATGEVRRIEGRDPATIEACAKAVRDTICGMDWPPQDGDQMIDALLLRLRALAAPAVLTEDR